MPTPTTLKLPDPLKERIAPLANAAGVTPHAWMVEALERQAMLAEARESFLAEAETSAREVDAGGALYAAEDVLSYVVARGAGRHAAVRPRPVKPAAATSPKRAATPRSKRRA
jgi:predicted transcriptional regulator